MIDCFLFEHLQGSFPGNTDSYSAGPFWVYYHHTYSSLHPASTQQHYQIQNLALYQSSYFSHDICSISWKSWSVKVTDTQCVLLWSLCTSNQHPHHPSHTPDPRLILQSGVKASHGDKLVERGDFFFYIGGAKRLLRTVQRVRPILILCFLGEWHMWAFFIVLAHGQPPCIYKQL